MALLGLIIGQRAQEHVNRQVQPPGMIGFTQQQLAVEDRQVLFRRDEIHRIGLDPHAFLGAAHRHGGPLGKQLDHHALVVG